MPKAKQDVWCLFPPPKEPSVQLDRVNMILRRHRGFDCEFRDMTDGVLLVRAKCGYLGWRDLNELNVLVTPILRILRAEIGGDL